MRNVTDATSPTPPPAATNPPGPTPEQITAITSGYGFDTPSLLFGSAVFEDTIYPEAKVRIPLSVMNRHGLVAGATGTGKTKTLQLMAEQLSAAGVPVFAADIKGDLSGMSVPGEGGEKIASRAASVGQTWTATGFPVEYYALGGQGTGIPLRVTMTAFGPITVPALICAPLITTAVGLMRTPSGTTASSRSISATT